MKRLINLFFVLSICLLSSCKKKDYEFKNLPTGPIKHQLIVAGRAKNKIIARGLAGSTPPNTTVYFEIGSDNKSQISDKTGAFELELPNNPEALMGVFNFTLPDNKHESQNYTIKNISEALNTVAQEALEAPTEITLVKIHDNKALILAHDKAQLKQVAINSDWTLSEDNIYNILLNPQADSSLSPQNFDSYKQNTLVPFLNSDQLALINLSSNKIITKKKFDDQLAKSPQSVFSLGDNNFLVSYIALDAQKNPTGPGAVALININNNSINLKQIIQLPFKNPYAFKQNKNQEIWLSCTGAYKEKEDRDKTITSAQTVDAGLVKLKVSKDLNNLKIKHQIDLNNYSFAPAEFELVEDKLVIPELWGGRLIVIQEDSPNIIPDNINNEYEKKYKFTFATSYYQDILFLGDASGTLVAYSLKTGFFPFPFVEPIKLVKNTEINFNPKQLIIRNNKPQESYPRGFGAWVISETQNKIIPLDFLKIFGP